MPDRSDSGSLSQRLGLLGGVARVTLVVGVHHVLGGDLAKPFVEIVSTLDLPVDMAEIVRELPVLDHLASVGGQAVGVLAAVQ